MREGAAACRATPAETGRESSRPGIGTILAVPAAFLLIGLAIRYAAYAAGAEDPSASGFVEALCRWDCAWYLGIAEHGYNEFPTGKGNNVGNWGFFPLYPALVHVVGWLSPLATLQTATLTSLLLAFLACLTAWPLLGRLPAYAVYCAYVLAGPFSYHFSTALTEALFLLLTSLAMLGLQRRAYLGAAVASALLAATRIVGVFMVLASVLGMLGDHRRAGGTLRSFPAHLLGRPDLLLAIFVSPLGLFTYMLLLWTVMGDGLAFAHVQRAFGRVVDWPFLHWWDAASAFGRETPWPTPPQWSAIAVVVALGLTGVLAWRRQWGLALFCLIAILLPISAGLASIVRYTAALAPLALLLAALLGRNRATAAIAAAIFAVLCYLLTQEWIRGSLVLV